jgi:ferredoxin-NADP reductase
MTERNERAPALESADLINVRLTMIHYATRNTNLFEFSRIDGEALTTYEPGAHIDLHLPDGLIR